MEYGAYRPTSYYLVIKSVFLPPLSLALRPRAFWAASRTSALMQMNPLFHKAGKISMEKVLISDAPGDTSGVRRGFPLLSGRHTIHQYEFRHLTSLEQRQ